jgi:tRNA (guanine37-N1)-methyltransferase
VQVHVITLFPEIFAGPLAASMLGRARDRGLLTVSLHQLRDYATGRHLQVDDAPYGGGSGMVLKPEPVVAAIEHVCAQEQPYRILLGAGGTRFTQAVAERLAEKPSLLLVCGRYEGVDDRVRPLIDEELSIGDYVLTGGELAALVVIDAVARLRPGVLGNDASSADESFTTGLLEYPQYTRPPEFRGVSVPPVLISGDHGAVARWRREQSLRLTFARRPDLLASAPLDPADRAFLRALGWPPNED